MTERAASPWSIGLSGGWLGRRVLPWVLALVALKAVLQLVGFEPLALNALISGVVAANVFLLGFVLAGTLADFKEAERLPVEVAASLESIADECWVIDERKDAPVATACVRQLSRIAMTARAWLEHRESAGRVLAMTRDLNHFFAAFEPLSQGPFINRIKGEQREVRRMLLRIEVIRSTSFVTAGYAVAELASGLVLLGLLLTKIGSLGEALFFTGVIGFLLLYMHRLIRDLDNPFEYRDGVQGAADVSLAPLDEVAARLASRLGAGGHPSETQDSPRAA